MKFKLPTLIKKISSLLLVFTLGAGAGFLYFDKASLSKITQQPSEDKYILFLSEVFDKTKENYWDAISEEKLTTLYKTSAENLTGKKIKLSEDKNDQPNPVIGEKNVTNTPLNIQGSSTLDLKIIKEEKPKASTKGILMNNLKDLMKSMDDNQKKDFTVKVASAVLANLTPNGRSGLFNQKQQENLKNTVSNINPDKDLYADLGLSQGATIEQVEDAYNKLADGLKKEGSPEAKEKLKKITYAKDVLATQEKKQKYDTAKVEPTVFTKVYSGQILYLRVLKYSPTTYEEFVKALDSYNREGGPQALIFDLRNNLGGAIDSVPFFMGNFIGKNQLASEFFQRGEPIPFKTTTDKLPSLKRYKQIVVLVDDKTQSSAELMAAGLKKYNQAILVGTPTKGWGTVERVFQLQNQIDEKDKYSMFLVHSLTLRDDGLPIEGRGVEPNISIQNQNWQFELNSYFRYPELTQAVNSALQEPTN